MSRKNGGFSLIELIVVVAIIAVLMGILGPQYIRYLESSRIRHDDSIISHIEKAANVLVSDGDYDEFISGDVTIYINNHGVASQVTGVGAALSQENAEFLNELNASVYGTAAPAGGFTSKSFQGCSNVYINLHYDATLFTFVPTYHNFPDRSIYHQ